MIDFLSIPAAEIDRRGRLSIIYVAMAEQKKRLAAKCGEAITLISQINRASQERMALDKTHLLRQGMVLATAEIEVLLDGLQSLARQRDGLKQGERDEDPA